MEICGQMSYQISDPGRNRKQSGGNYDEIIQFSISLLSPSLSDAILKHPSSPVQSQFVYVCFANAGEELFTQNKRQAAMSDLGAEGHARRWICRQGTRPVSAMSTGRECVRSAHPSGQSCSAAQVLRRGYKPQQTPMDICSMPSALLYPSGHQLRFPGHYFVLFALFCSDCTAGAYEHIHAFQTHKRHHDQMLWHWRFRLEQGRCKGRFCSMALQCDDMGSSISPFCQAQNSSLLPKFCLVRPYEFQNRDTSYLVQHPAGQDLQRLSQYKQ